MPFPYKIRVKYVSLTVNLLTKSKKASEYDQIIPNNTLQTTTSLGGASEHLQSQDAGKTVKVINQLSLPH